MQNAAHPEALPVFSATQRQVHIVGLEASRTRIELELRPGNTTLELTTISNPAALVADGVRITLTGLYGQPLPADLRAHAWLENHATALPPAAQVPLVLSLETATDDAAVHGLAITLRADGDIFLPLLVYVRFVPRAAKQVITPKFIKREVQRGRTTLLAVSVFNAGDAVSSALDVLLPSGTFVSVGDELPLRSLLPGEKLNLSLVVQPQANQALGRLSGSVVVAD